MKIQVIPFSFSVCQVSDYSQVDLEHEFCFPGRTDEERSLVCPTELVPRNTTAREDGWRAFRLQGVLDFSLIGILAQIAELLAREGIAIFALSTYNTDYILIKEARFSDALDTLARAGYEILT